MEEGGTSERCWKRFGQVSDFALFSPYAICLAAGDLYLQSFCECTAQELLFLKSFAKGYESAENCARNDKERAAISHLRNSALHYVDTHHEFVRDLCLDLPKEIISSATTEKYRDFLLTTVCRKAEGEGVAAYILASIVPCMKLYASMCRKIEYNVERDDNIHIYRKWIDNCSSLQAAAKETEDVLNILSANLTGEEVEEIENFFHQALKLGVEFFAGQIIYQETVVPLRRMLDISKCEIDIFCNFDMTCSPVYSSYVLEKLAIAPASRAKLHRLRDRWATQQICYDKELKSCVQNLQQCIPCSFGVGPTFDYKGLCKALEQVGEFQKRENSKVEGSKRLKGISLVDIKHIGQNILHDGCRRFLEKIARNESPNIHFHVISSCWCGDLIRSAFSSDLNVSSVNANELVYENSITTGEIVKRVESAMEKRKFFLDVVKACKTKGEHFTVCIGGKMGDLLCLLEADIGIVKGTDSNCPVLDVLCRHFGVELVPLSYGAVKRQRELSEDCALTWKPLSGVIYYVDSWTEIEAFILGFKDIL